VCGLYIMLVFSPFLTSTYSMHHYWDHFSICLSVMQAVDFLQNL